MYYEFVPHERSPGDNMGKLFAISLSLAVMMFCVPIAWMGMTINEQMALVRISGLIGHPKEVHQFLFYVAMGIGAFGILLYVVSVWFFSLRKK